MSTIVMKQSEYEKFEDYVDLCPNEVACFGYATEKDGDMYVDEIFLVPQEVSGAEVDFMTDGLPYAVERATKDDRVNDLRFCVHSHVNMGAFFSTTDNEMIESMGTMGTPWFASAVFNKKGETTARVDMYNVDVPGLSSVQVPCDIVPERVTGVTEEQRITELEEHVTKKKFMPPMTVFKHGATKQSKHEPEATHSKEEAFQLHLHAERLRWDGIISLDRHEVYYFDTHWEYQGCVPFEEKDQDWLITLYGDAEADMETLRMWGVPA